MSETKAFAYNIMLIGFMGSGKSTVSAGLHKQLGMSEAEMDAIIAASEGMSINDIFAAYGEPYFRDCETGLLKDLAKQQGVVVSCGGGCVLRPENVRLMKWQGKIVLLTARPETILERIKDSDERPILHGNKNVGFIRDLMEKRREAYAAAADLTIHTDNKTVTEICAEIIKGLAKDV